MPSGRCAGCGVINAERKVQYHIVTCDKYQALFETDPDKALDPAGEYQRYKTEEMTSDARAHRRDDRLSAQFTELSTLQDLQARRWRTPKDILED